MKRHESPVDVSHPNKKAKRNKFLKVFPRNYRIKEPPNKIKYDVAGYSLVSPRLVAENLNLGGLETKYKVTTKSYSLI